MNKRLIAEINTKDKKSQDTGVVYTKKLLDKAFKGKDADLVILVNGISKVRKIGTVKNIKITNYEDKVSISGKVKTSLDIDTENKILQVAFIHKTTTDRSKLKPKDFSKLYFYFSDKNMEDLLIRANDVGCVISKTDGTTITTAQMNFDELFENKINTAPSISQRNDKG